MCGFFVMILIIMHVSHSFGLIVYAGVNDLRER